MMNRFVRRSLKFGPVLWNSVASALGCFVFMRGFRLVAAEKEVRGADSSIDDAETSRVSSAGICAAIFLLVFIASEALAAVRAFRP